MNLYTLPWLILFLPLLAAAGITLFTRRDPRLSSTLSILAVVAGFILSVIFVKAAGWEPGVKEVSATWLEIGRFQAQFGLRLDALSLSMLLVVTGVASLIHIYSVGYMAGDPGFARFFASLSLFTFSMLGIVLANNFLQLFIFWELVGVSSYLLIGFWYEKASAADAAKKAFITNRLGDFGFLLGILIVWSLFDSLNFAALEQLIGEVKAGSSNPENWWHFWSLFGIGEKPSSFGIITIAGLLIFCGAVGKSAQFPLHVWLPDAMEGPTPVSALIHAATMVAAGVYMLCRVIFLLNAPALEIIAWVGGFTALLAALIAVQQNDIKRILAYSTLSQLGYMVMAVGLHGPTPAMFHLTTHAFFKALLFLGAGSVIVAMHHEQDIWNMGGLRKKMPVTFWTFMAGTLALAGLWPFSGFFSKDSILAQAWEQHNYALFAVGVLVATLTAFYMFRLVFVVFFGAKKSDAADHAHESPPVMTWPLRILAVLSVIGGITGIEAVYHHYFAAATAEHAGGGVLQLLFAPFLHAWVAALSGLIALAAGFAAAYKLYAGAGADPLPAKFPRLSRAMRNRFYFDEIYEATVIRVHELLAGMADWFERWIIEGLGVGTVRGGTALSGYVLRSLQSGNLQFYAFLFVLGAVLLLYFVLGRQ